MLKLQFCRHYKHLIKSIQNLFSIINQKQTKFCLMINQSMEKTLQQMNKTKAQFVKDTKSDANQILLDKNPHRYSAFEIDGSSQKKQEQTTQSHKLSFLDQDDVKCYPKCLSWIGRCVAPFLVCFPCCKFQCCCQNLPLFQQPTQSYGILQKWGSHQKLLNPGLHVINPISQKIIQINRQTKPLSISQIAFTKDNVQFRVDSVIFYRIIDSLKLAYKLGIEDSQCRQCVAEIAQACLRNIIGLNTLQTVIETREVIGRNLKEDLNKNLQIWGIYVEACNLKEIVLSQQIRDYLQSTARAKRMMEAQIINYQSQVEVGKLIKEMAQILSSKTAFQIRYLDVIGTIINRNPNSVMMIKTNYDEESTPVNVKPNQRQ